MTPSQKPLQLFSRLSGLWRRFVEVTSRQESGVPLALVRIGFGIATLILLVPFVCTDAGHDVVRFAFVDAADGGYRELKPGTLLRLAGGARYDVVMGVLTMGMVGALAMTVGIGGRLAVLLTALSVRMILGVNLDVSGGGDALMGNALFLLLWSDCTNRYSVDAWRRTGRFAGNPDDTVPAWPRQLIVVLLIIVYTTTGLQKLVSTSWTPIDGFSALFQILQSPQWARFPDFVPAHPWLRWPLAFMSIVTIVWEVGFAVVLRGGRWRWLVVLIGVGIHLGIVVSMQVGVFSWVSLALYPALFAPRASSSSSSSSSSSPSPSGSGQGPSTASTAS